MFLADKTMTHITMTQTELRLRITVWGYPSNENLEGIWNKNPFFKVTDLQNDFY